MAEGDRRISRLNEALIYAAVVVSLVVFVIASIPGSGMEVSQNMIWLLIVILVFLAFQYFNVIEIPGFLKLSRELKEVKEETREIRNSLQVLASSRSSAQAVVNVNGIISEPAQEARELRNETPSISGPVPDEQMALYEEDVGFYIQRGQFVAAFANLRRLMESELRQILVLRNVDVGRASLGKMVRLASSQNLLEPALVEALSLVKNVANTVVHSAPVEKELSMGQLRDVAEIGMRGVYMLQQKREELMQTTREGS